MERPPAFVLGRRMDVPAWNALADAVTGFSRMAPGERNVPRHVFLDPGARDLYPEWAAVAAQTVAYLRLDAGRYTDDRARCALVGELSLKSEDFRRLWADHQVKECAYGVKRIKAAPVQAQRGVRGDRRTPVAGGRDDGGPREGRVPDQAGLRVLGVVEVREPLRRSVTPFRCRLGRGAAPALPTSTNVPDAC